MPQIKGGISFDAGIEQILIQDDLSPAGLPESTRALPGDGQIPQRLDEVLSKPSVDQSLMDSLRPRINSRQILTPQGYKDGRLQAATDLRELRDGTSDPKLRNALDLALQLLDDVNADHDLLETNLMALHAG